MALQPRLRLPLIILLLLLLLLMFHLIMVNNMDNPILRDVYICTLTSDRDIRRINVVASSFGQAAANCLRSIALWENKESYELTKIQISDSVFINLNNFIK